MGTSRSDLSPAPAPPTRLRHNPSPLRPARERHLFGFKPQPPGRVPHGGDPVASLHQTVDGLGHAHIARHPDDHELQRTPQRFAQRPHERLTPRIPLEDVEPRLPHQHGPPLPRGTVRRHGLVSSRVVGQHHRVARADLGDHLRSRALLRERRAPHAVRGVGPHGRIRGDRIDLGVPEAVPVARVDDHVAVRAHPCGGLDQRGNDLDRTRVGVRRGRGCRAVPPGP